MKEIRPDDIVIIHGLPPVATSHDKVAIDTEFYGMDPERLHIPHGEFACATFSFDGVVVYIVQDQNDLPQAMKNVEQAVHLFHHAKFDIGQIRRYTPYTLRNRLWDTMLVEQVMFSGYYNPDEMSLKALARRYLGIYMHKEARNLFQDAHEMTKEMEEYSCIDTAATFRVFEAQRDLIDKDDLRVWKDIEEPFLFVLLAMSGMLVDQDEWNANADSNMAAAEAIQAKWGTWKEWEGPRGGKKRALDGILLSSWQQVGAEIRRRGFKIRSTNIDDIKHLADADEFIHDVVEFRSYYKAASTYGRDFMTKNVQPDGRIYSDWHQMGAGTGRPSSSKPNLENIPQRQGPAMRKCFIACKSLDNRIVDVDWSAQEPRLYAYKTQDKKLIQIFQQHQDVYCASLKLMFGWDVDKKDPRRNKIGKPSVLGGCYGLTKYGMQKKYGLPLDQGEAAITAFFNTFEGAKDNHDNAPREAGDYVTTAMGRKFWLNRYVKGWENNVYNSPIQGGGADALKIASFKFLMAWGWTDTNSILINLMHDEMVFEVPYLLSDACLQLASRVMIEVAESIHKGIPADVEGGIGMNWSEAHK
jgi:DNA polymerase-1